MLKFTKLLTPSTQTVEAVEQRLFTATLNEIQVTSFKPRGIKHNFLNTFVTVLSNTSISNGFQTANFKFENNILEFSEIYNYQFIHFFHDSYCFADQNQLIYKNFSIKTCRIILTVTGFEEFVLFSDSTLHLFLANLSHSNFSMIKLDGEPSALFVNRDFIIVGTYTSKVLVYNHEFNVLFSINLPNSIPHSIMKFESNYIISSRQDYIFILNSSFELIYQQQFIGSDYSPVEVCLLPDGFIVFASNRSWLVTTKPRFKSRPMLLENITNAVFLSANPEITLLTSSREQLAIYTIPKSNVEPVLTLPPQIVVSQMIYDSQTSRLIIATKTNIGSDLIVLDPITSKVDLISHYSTIHCICLWDIKPPKRYIVIATDTILLVTNLRYSKTFYKLKFAVLGSLNIVASNCIGVGSHLLISHANILKSVKIRLNDRKLFVDCELTLRDTISSLSNFDNLIVIGQSSLGILIYEFDKKFIFLSCDLRQRKVLSATFFNNERLCVSTGQEIFYTENRHSTSSVFKNPIQLTCFDVYKTQSKINKLYKDKKLTDDRDVIIPSFNHNLFIGILDNFTIDLVYGLGNGFIDAYLHLDLRLLNLLSIFNGGEKGIIQISEMNKFSELTLEQQILTVKCLGGNSTEAVGCVLKLYDFLSGLCF